MYSPKLPYIIVFYICDYTLLLNLYLVPCASDSDCTTGNQCINAYCEGSKLINTKFIYYIDLIGLFDGL